MEALCGRDVGRDAVGNRSGAFILGALADLTTVAVMGGQRQVGVEVSLAEVERSVGVFKDLMGTGRKKFVRIRNSCVMLQSQTCGFYILDYLHLDCVFKLAAQNSLALTYYSEVSIDCTV